MVHGYRPTIHAALLYHCWTSTSRMTSGSSMSISCTDLACYSPSLTTSKTVMGHGNPFRFISTALLARTRVPPDRTLTRSKDPHTAGFFVARSSFTTHAPSHSYVSCRWLEGCRQQVSSKPQGEVSASANVLMQRSGGQAAVLNQGWVADRIQLFG
jgi:hypothetical protein